MSDRRAAYRRQIALYAERLQCPPEPLTWEQAGDWSTRIHERLERATKCLADATQDGRPPYVEP